MPGLINEAFEFFKKASTSYDLRVKTFRRTVEFSIKYPSPNKYRNGSVFKLAVEESWNVHFSLEERAIINELFRPGFDYAWVEVIQGKPLTDIHRKRMFTEGIDYYLGPKGPPDSKLNDVIYDVSGHFLRRSDWDAFPEVARVHRMMHHAVRPINSATILSPESREQMILRRMDEGAYLFGSLGGLGGGAVFTVSHKVYGNEFDLAVRHGAIVASLLERITLHYAGKAEASKSFAPAWELAEYGPPRLRRLYALRAQELANPPKKVWGAPLVPRPSTTPKNAPFNLKGELAALRALAAEAERGAIPAGPGLKLSRGYDRRMGIPEEHLAKMIEAAKETKSIAVFRANKPAAIPLIRNGAVGKPKELSMPGFTSSSQTGVLTATDPAHVARAHKYGYFVVDADLVPRLTVNGVTKVLPLKNPSWTVAKGQVIHANGKPVVGDYDLAGVFPLESPGRNVTGVPKDARNGDWMGPDVKKYSDALNKRLDRPRVLHGAQDQFHDPNLGGLTDGTAYAVFPDGSVYVMDGRPAQEAFYRAYGRQTAVGEYPRPAPGAAVTDDLAARREQLVGAK